MFYMIAHSCNPDTWEAEAGGCKEAETQRQRAGDRYEQEGSVLLSPFKIPGSVQYLVALSFHEYI